MVREKKDIPIIMVSAKKDDIDKIRGLGLGDDKRTAFFSVRVLIVRLFDHPLFFIAEINAALRIGPRVTVFRQLIFQLIRLPS